jgi:hypothetical protein
MTQREHDEDLLAATEAAIEQCKVAIISLTAIPEQFLRPEDKISTREYGEALEELKKIRGELLAQLEGK